MVAMFPAVWVAATQVWEVSLSYPCSVVGFPQRILLNYLSGEPLMHGEMNPKLARAVAALATARLTSPVSGGGESIDKLHHTWQEEVSKPTYQQSGCPFGTRLGAWIAWQTVSSLLGSLDGVTV
jgi:hypothetical protein